MKWKCKPFEELTLDELYGLLQLRTEVFVVEQTCAYLEVDGHDQASWHLFAEENGQIIACLRILPSGETYEAASIGRVAVHTDFRGRGLADDMLDQAISFIAENWQEHRIQIGAQLYLQTFYEKHGFVPISEPYLEDGIAHVDMECRLSV